MFFFKKSFLKNAYYTMERMRMEHHKDKFNGITNGPIDVKCDNCGARMYHYDEIHRIVAFPDGCFCGKCYNAYQTKGGFCD